MKIVSLEKKEERLGNIFGSRIPTVTFVFLAMAPLVLVWYASFIFNYNNADNIFLYSIQIIADGIAMLVLLGLWMTILMDVVIEQHHRVLEKKEKDFLTKTNPTIDVFITVYGEPLQIIQKTVSSAVEMNYEHKTYILDDGGSLLVKELARKLGALYIARKVHEDAKAGNINHALSKTQADFFVILDADHVPKKDFITKLLPYMNDTKLAMVQSPQYFANRD